MSRPVASYANVAMPTCTVSGARVKTLEGFEPTENESTAENRQVYYQVGCKTCGSLYYKAKGTLAKPHKCPSCRTAHPTINSYTPSKPEKKAVLLVINSNSFQLVEGEISDALSLLSPENHAAWRANGQKVAHPAAGGLFKVPQSQPLQGTTLTPKPGPIVILDEPATASLAKPLLFGQISESARTPEEDRDTVEAEGYHSDLRRTTAACKLAPHNPNRKTFMGWLISQENLENLRNNQPAYTANQRAVRDAGEKDTVNEFEGATLTNVAEALKATPEFTGWLYLYKYHEEFDPNKHIYNVPNKVIKDALVSGSIDECYQIWCERNLDKEAR